MTDMNERVIGGQVAAVQRALSPFLELVMPPRPVTAQPVIANFAAGNPQEPPCPALLRHYVGTAFPCQSTGSPIGSCMNQPARRQPSP